MPKNKSKRLIHSTTMSYTFQNTYYFRIVQSFFCRYDQHILIIIHCIAKCFVDHLCHSVAFIVAIVLEKDETVDIIFLMAKQQQHS